MAYKTSADKKEWARDYYKKNKARIDAKNTRWAQEHREQRKAYMRQYNLENSARRAQLRHKNRDKTRNAARAYRDMLGDYKKIVGCLLCGYKEHQAALDFHHKDAATKSFTLSVGRGRSMENVVAEINKCYVLCANCHRSVEAEKRAKK